MAKKRVRSGYEIAPDEIFLDASNLPSYDQEQFEGRIVQPLSRRALGVFSSAVILFLAVLLMQAFFLQGVEGKAYANQSEQNRLSHRILFAERGRILDRNGVPLVENVRTEDDQFLNRVYKTPGFSHVLGYVSYPGLDSQGNFFSYEIVGIDGAERLFQDTLAGTNGVRLIETNALGEIASEGTLRLTEKGQDVYLSIDERVQSALTKAIEERADIAPFDGGAAAIMNVRTGELIALTSYPEYDSNILSQGNRENILSYQQDPRKPFLNRAFQGAYTPGSIVKPFVAYGALVDGIVSPEKTFTSTGALTIPNPYTPSQPSIFRDWKAHGVVDMRRALAVSSDVYFYAVGGGLPVEAGLGYQEGLGIDRLNHWFSLFGFGASTNIALSGEVEGVIPSRAWKEETFGEPWLLGNTYHTTIGQYGFTTTLLEALRATAMIANGGTVLTPTIEKLSTTPLAKNLSLDLSALRVVQEGMEQAVDPGGTAQGLSMDRLSIAAKTGTAELGASKAFVNSWVIGYFPRERPEYAFVVVMDKGPRENLFGAVSVLRTALDTLFREHPDMFQNGSLTLDVSPVQ